MRQPADLVAALGHALQAPSVHNTQPWRWRLVDDTVELHADRGRHLVATDPDGRDLVLSCGAALHHLLVALAAQGVEVEVTGCPTRRTAGTWPPSPSGPGPGTPATQRCSPRSTGAAPTDGA